MMSDVPPMGHGGPPSLYEPRMPPGGPPSGFMPEEMEMFGHDDPTFSPHPGGNNYFGSPPM